MIMILCQSLPIIGGVPQIAHPLLPVNRQMLHKRLDLSFIAHPQQLPRLSFRQFNPILLALSLSLQLQKEHPLGHVGRHAVGLVVDDALPLEGKKVLDAGGGQGSDATLLGRPHLDGGKDTLTAVWLRGKSLYLNYEMREIFFSTFLRSFYICFMLYALRFPCSRLRMSWFSPMILTSSLFRNGSLRVFFLCSLRSLYMRA